MSEYEHILVRTEGKVGVIELNRPKSLNALNRKMIEEIVGQLEMFEANRQIRVVVIQGNEKTFAAGADIQEMMGETPLSFEMADPFSVWDRFMSIKKPLIASVTGYALGGGFELALHCDLIIAAEDAKFGFPEVNLGVMPGAGGTQLLTRLIGKRKALEWIWLGEHMGAKEAKELGIINRITAPEIVFEETMRFAEKLAEQSPIALRLIKEAVNKAEDVPLREGLTIERKNFYLAFDSKDQKEGMRAFVEKRRPSFKGE
ncbi:enoyl-CoA hydratase-related protein [Pseudogracilibacillus sp. SE30717A]|uniref:enoyl-CoA hydratase-related protein n=1 Tax=Pseudogracilibacillus sp. SE30717A TaxID=3098293 RepID=UPI00300E2E0B